MAVYPITFSIPQIKIINNKYKKEKLLSSLIPGDKSTYIYNIEEEYYNEYRNSYFAITSKKAGWDCLRHYEIIANGCIPYFIDIDKCPPNTLYLFPKDLIVRGNCLYERMKEYTLEQIEKDESMGFINEYNKLINELLLYTTNHLTTKKMATYILNKIIEPTNISNVLYLSGNTSPDYLRCLTLHGFKELYGTKCHDFPKVPHIYKSYDNYKHLYGNGITYTKLLDDSLHDVKLDKTIIEDIQNHKYDIIIYGSYHRGMPFYDIVINSNYKSNVILLCGEDIHLCNYTKWTNKGHTVFVREL
jgi:hypothetical protein